MISSISSGIDYNTILSGGSANANSSKNSLTYEQQQSIDDILSNYDSSALTEDDALSIVTSLHDAGINPSKQLENAMSSLGFDAEKISDLSGISSSTHNDAITVSGEIATMNPSAVTPSSSYLLENDDEDEDTFNTVQTLLDSLFNNDEEEDEEAVSTSNTASEYASKASNLNDDAKQELINLFKKYSSEDNEYSSEDANTLVKNQLSEMFSDSKNYNHSTIYA